MAKLLSGNVLIRSKKCSSCGHMLKKQVPFKSIKITLSEEAVSRLAELRVRSSLRSDSATIEECIRLIYDISNDIAFEVQRARERKQKVVPIELQAETLRRIGTAIQRFYPLTERMTKTLRK